MNRINYTLTDLRAVLCLACTQSFRAASEELGMSPSALSRLMTNLEVRLNARLFDRDTRNVVVTAQGEVLVRIATRTLNVAEDGMLEFQSHLSAGSGRLTIAGLPSVTAGFLPQVLVRFVEKYPGIDLRIIDSLSGDVLDAVESGAADLGFTAGTISARRRLDFQPLLEDGFVAVGSPDGPLQEDRDFGWSELIKMQFIAMAPGTSVRELIDGACLEIGANLSPRFEVSQLATAGALVEAGLGITALPTLTLPVLNMANLVQREIFNFGAKRRIGLVKQPGRSLSPAAQAFCQILTLSNQKDYLSFPMIFPQHED